MTKTGIYLWSSGVISNPHLCCVPGTLSRFRSMWFCCGFRKQTLKESSLKPGAVGKASKWKQCGFPHNNICDPQDRPREPQTSDVKCRRQLLSFWSVKLPPAVELTSLHRNAFQSLLNWSFILFFLFFHDRSLSVL